MKGIVKSEFQLSATPDEHMSRHLAYLAAQDSGSVLTGGFVKDRSGFEDGDDSADKQTARAIEFLTQQEQIRQQRTAELASRLDALELAARDALMDAENDLGDILSNANRDRLGRAVFMDANGQLRDEDGAVVDPDMVDMAEWDGDAASWEQAEQAMQNVETATQRLEQTTTLQDRIQSDDLDDADLDALNDAITALESDFRSTPEFPNAAPESSGAAEPATPAIETPTNTGFSPMKPF